MVVRGGVCAKGKGDGGDLGRMWERQQELRSSPHGYRAEGTKEREGRQT